MSTNATSGISRRSHHGEEAVVGVFSDRRLAARAAKQLSGTGINIQRANRRPGNIEGEPGLDDLVFEDVETVAGSDVVSGMVKSGAIGAVSGLLLVGVPGIGLAAPIGGLLAGALIGGMAGVDEKTRAIEQPDRNDYNEMLATGKSLVVLPGDEVQRIEYEKLLFDAGADNVYQHPPTREAVREES